MAKKNEPTHDQKLINALEEFPNPLIDDRHHIAICWKRNAQSRFKRLVEAGHGLNPGDIKRIPRKINKSILKQDPYRTDTYNLYIKRNKYSDEYTQISLLLNPRESNKAVIKTIFITTNLK